MWSSSDPAPNRASGYRWCSSPAGSRRSGWSAGDDGACDTGGGLVTRERDLVELVDTSGGAVGTTTVAEAHAAPGQLHRAFSVLLFDPDGRTLLQQRASV